MLSRELDRLTLALLGAAALHAIAWTVAARHHAASAPDPLAEMPVPQLVEPAPADRVKPDMPESPSDPVARSPVLHSANNSPVSRSHTAAAPPATAAQAAAAMASDTGDPLVVGNASAYAGGATTGPGGSGGVDAGPPDLSVPADLGGAVQWECKWPERFSNGFLDGRKVIAHVAVEVDVDGRAVHARVTEDPGHGFGKTAHDCALQGRYIPGRGADGRVARAWTKTFLVIFDPPTVIAAPEKGLWETSTAQ